jgi:hypothetical protein
MAGFLEGLGRSNALSSVNTLANTAITLKGLQNREDQQVQENAINLEKMGIMKAEAEREKTKFDWAAKEQKAKEDALDMPVPITKFLGTDYQTDPAKKAMFDKAKEKGMVWEAAPGVVMSTTRHAQSFKKYMEDDLAFTKGINETNMVRINNRIAEIGSTLTEESNPKKVEELNKEKSVLEGKLGVLADAHKRIDFEFQKKLELEKTKQGGKITKGPGGALYQKDSETGEMVELVAPAEKDQWVDENRNVGGKPVEGQRNKATNEWRQRAQGQNININTNGLTPAENDALSLAVEEGRLDPNRINSRTAKVFAQLELKKPGQNFAGLSADINANRGSIQWQQKNRDLMSSFVANIGKQHDRLKDLTKKIELTDTRLLNLPLVEFRKRVSGDPELSKVAMYLTEISNEAARLSSGNAASIAELSLGAQERWAKIHDPYLPIKDILNLTKETYHAGVMRLETVDETLSESRKRMNKGKGKDKELEDKTSDPYGIR